MAAAISAESDGDVGDGAVSVKRMRNESNLDSNQRNVELTQIRSGDNFLSPLLILNKAFHFA